MVAENVVTDRQIFAGQSRGPRNVGRLASMKSDRQTQRTKYRNPRYARVNNKVTFVGEGAIDSGGPRREFFRLFAQQMFLVGSPACKF